MKKLLVIGEDPTLQSLIREITEAESYRVLPAADMSSCMPLAKREKPDLIICDIASRNTEDYAVIGHLRAEKSLDRIPLIFITSGSSFADIRTGMQLGADDFITKPVGLTDLSAAIATRLNRFDAIRRCSRDLDSRASNKQRRIRGDTVMVRVDKRQELIKVNDILLIKTDGGSSVVHLQSGMNLIVRKPLKNWLAVLPETLFMAINRSTAINISRIEKMEKWFNNSYAIMLKDHEERLVISRRHFRNIREKLGL